MIGALNTDANRGPVMLRREREAGGEMADDAQRLSAAGRHGDSVLVHVSPEELEALRMTWGEPTVNPDTGLPEYFKLGSILKTIAPLALAVAAPGLGAAIGSSLGASAVYAPILGNALLGAGFGGLTGGGLKGALKGGALSGGAAVLMPMLNNELVGTEFGDSLGLSMQPSLLDSTAGGAALSPGGISPSAMAMQSGAPAVDPGIGIGTTPAPSLLDRLKIPAMIAGGALLAGGALGAEQPQVTGTAPVDPVDHSPLPDVEFDREYVGPDTAAPYYQFGTVPFSFFQRNELPRELARGGALSDPGTREGYVRGPGDGREDAIPARLSNNEYVMDAETVALLGNGSPDRGASALDDLRSNLRRHKGAALARGKFTPDAKKPAAYMKGGR